MSHKRPLYFYLFYIRNGRSVNDRLRFYFGLSVNLKSYYLRYCHDTLGSTYPHPLSSLPLNRVRLLYRPPPLLSTLLHSGVEREFLRCLSLSVSNYTKNCVSSSISSLDILFWFTFLVENSLLKKH